jgi:hypothetical protein
MKLLNVLAAVLPLVTQIPPLPTILQATTQASIFSLVYGSPEIDQVMTLMLVSETSKHADGPPRPEQGGQRITPEWLNSLTSRDCLWRFR